MELKIKITTEAGEKEVNIEQAICYLRNQIELLEKLKKTNDEVTREVLMEKLHEIMKDMPHEMTPTQPSPWMPAGPYNPNIWIGPYTTTTGTKIIPRGYTTISCSSTEDQINGCTSIPGFTLLN